MKNHCILIAAAVLLLCADAQAQINNVFDRAVRAGERRVNNKIDQAIEKSYDKAEENAKKKKKAADSNPDNAKDKKGGEQTESGNGGDADSEGGAPAKTASLKSYGKFDFVPGEKVIVAEDFAQDAIGDFPDKWNSTGSGAIMTIDGRPGHWLMLDKMGEYLPEFIKSLPDNFTLQFDLAANETFSFYSSYLWINLVQMTNPSKDFAKWGRFLIPTEGVRVGLHPRSAGTGTGITEFVTYAKGEQVLKNETDQHAFTSINHNVVKVSMWRQKQRLRVYVDETKIWDIPRAFQPGVTYNGLVLSMGGMHKDDDRYYVSDFRLAVGAPDTRNKLLTEGRFVTRGILFNVNSDKIKPESYGVLKEIAQVLQENPAVKVRVIGHTDSDGDAAKNTDLSKRRAASVKSAISGEFGIDGSRMETDGKGASQPSGPNTTAEGKANNRRVEFIKL